MMPSETRRLRVGLLASIAFMVFCLVQSSPGADLRLGIVGTDTSHAVEFTKILNDVSSPGHVAGARVVAAYRGGSPDIAASRDRIAVFSTELSETWHIPFVKRISDLCPLVDGILLESVDGRAHPRQFREAAKCGKPVFIDKPLASTLVDALEISKVAAAAKVPWFSSSSLRYSSVQAISASTVTGAFVWGPGPYEKHHQLDLSWYGVHTVEMLFTIMGPGVKEVMRVHSPEADVVTGVWKDDRIGTLRVSRSDGSYGAVAYDANGHPTVDNDISVSYSPLLEKIVQFMRTDIPPVPNSETLEIFRFMDAAQRSREHGGAPVLVNR